jgi:hypothetical protein
MKLLVEWNSSMICDGWCSVIGVLQVDSKSLRNHLIPITVRTLDTIIALLIKNARDETLSVLNTFQDRIRQLEIRPLQLDAFVNFVTVRKQFFVFFPPHVVELSVSSKKKHSTKTLSLDIQRARLKKKPAKKYISIQGGMKLRKRSILVVN